MFSPTFRALIILVLATGAYSCGNRSPLSFEAIGSNATVPQGVMLDDYQCVGNFGPCDDGHCSVDCCRRLCLSSYSGLNPCFLCEGYPIKFCICYHDCY
nr:defensin-like protein 183 isoform X2 [Ipomoea batatas]